MCAATYPASVSGGTRHRGGSCPEAGVAHLATDFAMRAPAAAPASPVWNASVPGERSVEDRSLHVERRELRDFERLAGVGASAEVGRHVRVAVGPVQAVAAHAE